jgi:Tol biopolymer transport system component
MMSEPDQGVALAAPGVPGARWEAMSAAGGTRRARVVFSLALVALVLLASVAAWQAFVHSTWASRLRGMNQIIFVGGASSEPSNSSAAPQLYAIQPDGSGLHQLTTQASGSYFSPAWSPDGSRIAAFDVANKGDPVAHLVVMDADGANAHLLPTVALPLDTFNKSIAASISMLRNNIAWSPDGSQLVALVSSGQYMLIHTDGTRPYPFNGLLPTWSPDGRYLAYYVDVPSNQDTSDSGGQVYTIELLDTQTYQTRQLSGLPALDGEALAWSPNGRYLAVSAFQGGSFQSRPIDSIMLVRPDGSNPVMIAQWLDAQVQQAVWSSDSQNLAVVVQHYTLAGDGTFQLDAGAEVWVLNLDGSNTRQIGLSDGGTPSWSPDGKRLVYDGTDGQTLLIADTSVQPKATIQTLSPSLAFLFAPCWSPLGGI